ncbi:MAG: DUF2218 domain-containing protein [Pseudonocardiaceae bacterium]
MIPRWRSEALVETPRAPRYLTQLCKHFAHEAEALPGRVRIEYNEEYVFADFGWLGSCIMHARPEGLQLRAAARDPIRLLLVERVMASHLELFGRRDGLLVRWSRTSGS